MRDLVGKTGKGRSRAYEWGRIKGRRHPETSFVKSEEDGGWMTRTLVHRYWTV